MRTIVNTTKRTTYVVTDHDIIEALASLGIPRSVLFSGDTAIKVEGACVRDEEGFFFVSADDSTFLTVEAPAEESESESESEAPTPKPDVYPNGTVLIGQYSGVAYTIRGYDPATSTYTVWSEQDRDSFQSPREVTHNERFYRVKPAPTPAPEPAPTPTPAPEPDRFPVGTILRYCDNEYFVVGYVAPPEEYAEGYRLWCIDEKRTAWERYLVAHDPKTYTVVHRPTPGAPTPGEGAPANPFPVGTVLRNVGGFVSCITGYGPNDWYTTCTDQWGTGCDVDRVLRSSRYTVLYRPPSKA